jgi:Zn ribbon nucleic-acid-binding protein
MRSKNGKPIGRKLESAAPCCAICGSTSVVWDEVWEQENLTLGECLHCEYRWTHISSPPSTRAMFEASVEPDWIEQDSMGEAA